MDRTLWTIQQRVLGGFEQVQPHALWESLLRQADAVSYALSPQRNIRQPHFSDDERHTYVGKPTIGYFLA